MDTVSVSKAYGCHGDHLRSERDAGENLGSRTSTGRVHIKAVREPRIGMVESEFGEPVASGLYFYTLTAGNFTATRKMLIRK